MAFSQRRKADWNYNPYAASADSNDIAALVAQMLAEQEQYKQEHGVGTHISSAPIGDVHSAARFGTAQTGQTEDYIPSQYPTNTQATIMAQQYAQGGSGYAQPPPTPKVPKAIDAGVRDSRGGGGGGLLAQLIKSASVVPQIDYQALIDQNQQAIREAYAPQIKGLQQQNRLTKREFTKDEGLIEAYANQAFNKWNQQGENAADQTQQNLKDIQKTTDQRATQATDKSVDQAQKLSAVARRMGAGDAGMATVQDVVDYGQQQSNRVQKEGKLNERVAGRTGKSRENMLATMAQGAHLAGEDAIGDLIDQRRSILSTNRANIATLRGERGQELSNIETTLSVKEAEDQVSAENQVWDRLNTLWSNVTGQKNWKAEFGLKQQQLAATIAGQSATDQLAGYPKNWENTLTLAGNTWGQGSKQYNDVAEMITGLAKKGVGPGSEYESKNQEGVVLHNSPERIGQILYKMAIKKYGWTPKQAQYLLAAGQSFGTR